MTTPGSSPLSVDPERQQQRLDELRDRFENAQPLRLTLDGLTYWHATATEPQPLAQLTGPLRDEANLLCERGLVTPDGTVPDGARPAVDAIGQPLCTIDVDARVGRTGRNFRAWVGASCAVMFSTDPPWAGVTPTAEAVATYDEAPEPARIVQLVPPEWCLVAAARWASVTPRRVREPGEFTVPAKLFDRRLADHTAELPADAAPWLAQVWQQPMYVWAMVIQPTGAGLLILDAGRTGHFHVDAGEAEATLSAVPSLTVWDTMVEMLEAALT